MIFVSAYQSPSWFKGWILIGPWITGSLATIDFIIIPCISIINFGSNHAVWHTSVYGNYLALNLVISIFIMCWAPFTLRHAVKFTYEKILDHRKSYFDQQPVENDVDFAWADKATSQAKATAEVKQEGGSDDESCKDIG